MDKQRPLWLPALAGLCMLVALVGGLVWGEPEAPRASDPRYVVSSVVLEFERLVPGLPDVQELLATTEVELAIGEDGYEAPREGLQRVRLRLQDLPELEQQRFHASAIRTLSQAVVSELNQRGYVDIHVAPTLGQFSATGRDLRPTNALDLKLGLRFGQITGVTTTTAGARFGDGETHPVAHERILRLSPIGPTDDAQSAPERVDTLRKDLLDDYLYTLNRHPGRRVDAQLAPTPGRSGVTVDYVVTENKPWLGYAQLSNTGTDNTSRWRERVGYVNNQLTNRDDILSLDFITAAFDEVNAGSVQYEGPLLDQYRTRWRVNGFYSEFSSSDLGIFGANFSGDDWSLGGELTHNFYQHRQLFLDLYMGAAWRTISAENAGLGGDGEDSYFLPHLGLRLERSTDTSTLQASIGLEFNLADVAGTERADSELLGRSNPDIHWQTLSMNLSHSFYLEPVLFRTAWHDPATVYSSTLAHEIVAGLRYQNSLGNRLIPHMERTVGGLYTVRGYEESTASGDDMVVANLEYRFHIPRVLAPRPHTGMKVFGKDFRTARETVYGRPDWDLVAKAFVDVGRTGIVDATILEDDHTLLGTGVGLDFVLWQNLSIRTDWGVALRDVGDRAKAGDSEFHLVATWLF